MPWIYAIARHTRLDAYRKQRRLESREVLVASVPEGRHPVLPEAPREQDDFDGLIASLPEAQREVIVMLKVSGMSLEEVAKATSSTIGAVKQKAHRAYDDASPCLGNGTRKCKIIRVTPTSNVSWRRGQLHSLTRSFARKSNGMFGRS